MTLYLDFASFNNSNLPPFLQSSVVSEGGTRELNNQTQALLLQHLQGREAERKAQIHTQALLAQINTDLELLMSMFLSLL